MTFIKQADGILSQSVQTKVLKLQRDGIEETGNLKQVFRDTVRVGFCVCCQGSFGETISIDGN